MFRKTLLRLTITNSIVFAILISSLGSILYFYTEHRLYEDVNRSLLEAAGRKDFPHERTRDDDRRHGEMGFRDPRIIVLQWNEKNNLSEDQAPEAERFQELEKNVRPKNLNKLDDVTIGDFTFRYYAVKATVPFEGTTTLQFLRNINSEKEFLGRLMLIIITGCGIAMAAAVIFGYFLAKRSLIPIQNAWGKQQQFVSDASHELRTPLAVIQAKTDLLFRSPSATIEERILDISAISNESRRLSKLVRNLLTLARSDSNQIEVIKQPFQLDQLLKELASQYEEIISYQEKELLLDIPEPVTFTGDKERIHQLIVILLDNAMKFTGEGGIISLSCRQSHSSIELIVEDNGIGINEDDIPKIFDRFYQSDKARTLSEGTGLGLSIAHWIIEKHHGKVNVTSRIDKGTRIGLTFPKNQKA